MPIYHATTQLDGETFHWVSLDGEDWLPINRPPDPRDTEEMVATLFNGDGNFRPLRFARRWLAHQQAEFGGGD